MLASVARVPIVMVYQDGPARKFHRSHLIVAPPFRFDPGSGMDADTIQAQTKVLEEKMKDLLDRVERLAIEEAGRIVGGEITIAPYRYGNGASAKTGCMYCPYRGLCRAEKSAPVPYRQITSTEKEETEE